jgi:hypothetical protein
MSELTQFVSALLSHGFGVTGVIKYCREADQ